MSEIKTKPTDDILVIENLTKVYGTTSSVNKLNLKIKRGTAVGFLGPNGAGKSTTIKILTGTIGPTLGTAYINGYDITKDIRNALFDVGSMVETPAFVSYLTPEDILFYFGKLRGMSDDFLKSRMDIVFELVKLESWRKEKIETFSKGMRQRVGIASAILHDPSLLILDEPTDGLDPRGRQEITEIFQSLKEQGKTLFISSHILNEIQDVCDTIAVIDKGKLIDFQNISDLDTKQVEVQTMELVTQQQLDLILKLDGITDIKHESNTLFLKYGNLEKQQAELLIKLQEIGLKIMSFHVVDSDLEKLYMDWISESTR